MPEVEIQVPGRINVIGEHTDYAGGLSLPAAVDRYLAVAVSRRSPTALVSAELGSAPPARGPAPTGGWADHGLGVLSELRKLGVEASVGIAIASDIPIGAGLSSSAAMAVAICLAVSRLNEVDLDAMDVARLCRRAENEFLGVPSGLMDEVGCLLGKRGHALLFDATAETVTPVALPGGVDWLVCESGVNRSLRTSAYGDRVAHANEGKRARHIASENERVVKMVEALRAADLQQIGELLLASHRSLAEDYQVSTPELDELVGVAVHAGCAGARLMGAGFGGSIIAAVRREEASRAAALIGKRYPTHRVVTVDGAMTPAPPT